MSGAEQFSLTINISDKAYEVLRDGGYNICLCRKVNDTYNTVWYGSSEFLPNNQFQWCDSYEIFGAVEPGAQGIKKGKVSNSQKIEFNQYCHLDEDGKMKPVIGMIDPGNKRFRVEVDYSGHDVHIGIAQAFGTTTEDKTFGTSILDEAKTSLIYLSKKAVPSSLQFDLGDSFILFFDPVLKTGMPLDKKIKHRIEVNYPPGTKSLTCFYGDDLKWKIQESSEPETNPPSGGNPQPKSE